MDTKKLRQKILDLAIRGKLVPQDPNDEPASVLLERIRAEKEQLIKEGKIKRSKKSAASDTSHYENVPFEVPESWCWVSLSDVCNVARGGSPRPIKEYLTDDKNGINWIKIGDADKDGKYINSTKEKISPSGISKSRMVHKGDFLLTNSMSFGRPYILNIDGCIHDGWLVISPIPKTYDPEFLYYLLSSGFAYSQFTEAASGGVVSNLNSDKVGNSLFPLPPQSEQKRLVSELEKLFEAIRLIDNNKLLIRHNIEQIRSKILELAISGKLAHQNTSDEPAIELLKRINPAYKPADNRHYRNVPKGWTVCMFGDILEYEQPQQYIVNSTDYSDEYEIPVLTAGKSFIIGKTNEKSGICKHLPVIIFDDFTTDSKYVDFPFKVKSSAMKILHAKGNVNPKYVAYLMSVTRLVGDTHKRYWISEYSKIPIMLPPVNEQERIVSLIEKTYDRLDKILAEL